MKKLLILTAFLLPATFLFSQGTKFYSGSVSDLKTEVATNNSSYFVYFHSSDCNACTKMDNSFADSEVASFANANLPGIKIDVNSVEGAKLAKEYDINSTPGIVFLGPTGSVYNKIEDALDNLDMLALMKRYHSVNETK